MGLYDGTNSWPENWRSALIEKFVKVSSTFGHCCQNLEVYTCLYIYIYIQANRSTTWRTVVFQCFRQTKVHFHVDMCFILSIRRRPGNFTKLNASNFGNVDPWRTCHLAHERLGGTFGLFIWESEKDVKSQTVYYKSSICTGDYEGKSIQFGYPGIQI